ncbi:MAG: sulfatase [Bacteroidales bacterium]|nr:sulfatase [Bacteroidales bacterium]
MKIKHAIVIILLILLPKMNIYGQELKPNFIIFIADDVSWNDFGCYGNKQVQTPNIDKLAANGIKFTNLYLTASSCSPSRNSIITGRYPHNTGAAELHTEPPIQMISFPEVLRHNNYYSVQAGKFHMGEYAKRGFDIAYTNRENNGDGGEELWVKSIKERPMGKPFFMWFASYDAHRSWGPNEFTGTHIPEQINPPFYLANGSETKADLAKYYDEIKRFDYSIGEVIKELNTQNILDNTVIIVMADNGRPFPHSKTRVNDRGMKTPFIIHWPDRIKNNGSICNSLVSAIDIAPTIMALAGIDVLEQFQGFSFESLIDTPGSKFRNYVFAEHNWHDYEAHERMLRNKDYMYILNSRPLAPQMGPLDAIGSPSFKELKILKDSGKLSAIQTDVFMVPRPNEELYDYHLDSLQLLNVSSLPEYSKILVDLRKILKEWMEETGDNIPVNLTKSWYFREPGIMKTKDYNVRGEMPGEKLNSTENNNKGRF